MFTSMRQVLPFPRPSVHLISTPISLTRERATRSACFCFVLFFSLFVLSCSDYFTLSATRSGRCRCDWWTSEYLERRHVGLCCSSYCSSTTSQLSSVQCPAVSFTWKSDFSETLSPEFDHFQPRPSSGARRCLEKKKRKKKAPGKCPVCVSVFVCERERGFCSCLCVDVCASAELEKKKSLSTGATSS